MRKNAMMNRFALGGAAALVMLTAAACGNDDPAPDPTPTTSSAAPSPTPTTPKEKAKADAQAMLEKYYTTLNEIGQDPSIPLTRLKTVAIATNLAEDQQSLREWRAEGRIQKGDTVVTKVRVEEVSLDNSNPAAGVVPYVVFTVCTDVSDVDVVDRTGKSVVLETRPDVFTSRVAVDNHSWKTNPRDGWRVGSIRTKESGSCTL